MRRWRLIGLRWLRVLLVELVAISGLLLATSLLLPRVLKSVRSVEGWAPWMFVPAIVLAVAFAVLLARGGMLGNIGARKAYANPPRWLQILLFLGLVVAVWTIFPPTIPSELGPRIPQLVDRWGLRAIEGLIGVVALCVLWPHAYQRLKGLRAPKNRESGLSLTEAAFDELREWLRTDDQIFHPKDDAFDHTRIAERISFRIAKAAEGGLGRCPTFALVGELGAGKSSVLELVRHSLHRRGLLDQRVLVVSASLWPFESADAAIRGILRRIEAEFARITSTTAIAAVPNRYLKAIEEVHKGAGAVASILVRDQTPEDALAGYSRLAALIGVHVVVWIEDMERFERAGDAVRASPIRALLYQLQRFDQLTVVLASDNLAAGVDFQKIAQFVERIPPIDTATAWPIVSRFRQGCLAMLGEKEIDPASPKARKILSPAQDPALPFLEEQFGATTTPQGAIAHLCQTPRVLKHSLRATLDAWEVLRGEVDFDDVLLMCVLRSARPDVFALVDEYVVPLSNGPSKHRRDNQKDDTEFQGKLAQLLAGDPPTKMAVDEILEFVFPARPGASLTLDDKPQGLAIRSPRNYWLRFLTMAKEPMRERDQPVLRAIARWNDETSKVLRSVVSSQTRSRVVEHFVDRLRADRVLGLLEEIAQRRLGEDPGTWPITDDDRPDDRGPPGVTSVWRMCHRKLEKGEFSRDAAAASLERILAAAVPKNLRLAHEFLHFFVTHDSAVDSLVDDVPAQRLVALVEGLLRGYSGSPERVVNALRGSYRFTLFWICWRLDRIRSRQHLSGVPFEGWEDFSATLLDAAQNTPEVMLPQIVWFFVSYTESIERGEHGFVQRLLFDGGVADRLFGIEQLRRVFDCPDSSLATVIPQTMDAIRFARLEIAKLIQERAAGAPPAA